MSSEKIPKMRKQSAHPDYPTNKQIKGVFLIVVSILFVVVARHYLEATMLLHPGAGRPENFVCIRCFTTHLPSGGFLFTEPSAHLNAAIEEMKKNNSTSVINDFNIGSVLFLHGNAGEVADWTVILDGFRSKKMTVHMLEYAGFGNAKNGSIWSTPKSIRRDLREAWQILKEMDLLDGGLARKAGNIGSAREDDNRRNTNLGLYTEIIVVGYSLGGAVVTQWLQEIPRQEFPKGIILLNTFAEMRAVVGHVTGFPSLVNLLENDWSAQKGLQHYTSPDFSFNPRHPKLPLLVIENPHNLHLQTAQKPNTTKVDYTVENVDNDVKVGYVCIVHTQNDRIIPAGEAAQLAKWSGKRARPPLLLSNGDHFAAISRNFLQWTRHCL